MPWATCRYTARIIIMQTKKKPISDDFRLRGPVIKESFHTKGATSIVVCIGVFPVAHIGPVGEGSTARHIYNIIDRSQRCLVVYS